MGSVQEVSAQRLAQLAKDRKISPEELINRYAESMATRILEYALKPGGWKEAGEKMGYLQQVVNRFQDLLPLIPGN